MKNLKIIIPNIVMCIIVCLVAVILPIEIKNTTSFIYTLICYIFFNIVGCFLSTKMMENTLSKNIHNIPTMYIYVIFDILLTIILFFSRCINISISISIILTLILLAIYFIIIYSLIYAKGYINNNENKIREKTYNAKNWISSIEVLVNNEEKNNKDLEELLEILKYMDITSKESMKDIDDEINELVKSLEKNIELETIKCIKKLVNKRKIILKNEKR